MTEKPTAVGLLVGVPILTGFATGAALLHGLVLRDLWRWFAVPLGAEPIGIVHAMGLSGLFGCFWLGLTMTLSRCAKTPLEGNWFARALYPLTFIVVGSLFAWGFGAIEARFM